MLVLRCAKTLALWAVLAVLASHAYMRSVSASTLDTRLVWGLPLVALALLAGHGLATLLGTRRRWPALGPDRHALALLAAIVCVDGLANVEAHTSIRVLREQVPPLFAWVYPGLAFLTPLLLRAGARHRDAADQALIGLLAVTSLSGAVFLLSGPAALALAVTVLLMQLAAGSGRVPDGQLLRLAGAVVSLLLAATLMGPNRLTATPALAWILASAATGLAVAARPRARSDWQTLLSAPVGMAVVVACCGLLLTVDLGLVVDWRPALQTRLTLFRQHPNFLAPFFAFHAVLAVGLAGASRKLVPLAAAALLAASTIMTDSRAGIAALCVGLLAVPGVFVLRRLTRRVSTRALLLTGLVPLVLVGLLWSVTPRSLLAPWASGFERLEKSMDYRADAWRNSLDVVAEHPWLGIGPHTFVSMRRFEPGSRFFNEPTAPHPHNIFLYMAQAAGLPALFLFVLWCLLLLIRLLHLDDGDADAPRPLLVAALTGATLALLLADMLDLGLALETVVPAPIFLATGLVLAGRGAGTARARPAHGLAWIAGIAALALPFGLDRIRADTLLEQAELQAFLANRLGDGVDLKAHSRAALRASLALDPDNLRAAELLSRGLEGLEGGFPEAHRVLLDLLRRAPEHGPVQSLLGRLYLRAGMCEPAVLALQRAVAGGQGGSHLNEDRGGIVTCLARLGRRAEALDMLVGALHLDVGITAAVPWQTDPKTGEKGLPVPSQEPIRLSEAVEQLFAAHRADQQAGRPVGRRFWMDTYNAFRRAGRDDRALAVLDYLEEHQEELPFVRQEPHVIASERALVAWSAGDLEGALAFFELAYTHKPLGWFRTQAARVRHDMGATEDVLEDSRDAFQAHGEILDLAITFHTNLLSRAQAEQASGRPLQAARLLQRTLLFVDDLLERARLWLRIADLDRQAGAWDRARDDVSRTLAHLAARPFPVSVLQEGYTQTLPGRAALVLSAAGRGLGWSPQQRLEAAWDLPEFFSSRPAASLFRLAFYAENGLSDRLLREAELQVLVDEANLHAHWAQLEALEGLGQHARLPEVMRALADDFGERADPERLHGQLVQQLREDLTNADAWIQVALVTLLRGRYAESVGLLQSARELLPDDPHGSAHLAGWQARAAFLAGQPDAARRHLEEAVRLAPECEGLQRRLGVLP